MTHEPLPWLWTEIERRYGPIAREELHQGYLAEKRRYDAARRRLREEAREKEHRCLIDRGDRLQVKPVGD